MTNESEIIGLVPAAGRARRLGDAIGGGSGTGSKEVLPLASLGVWRGASGAGDERPLPVAGHLLRAMARAGVGRCWVVHRRDKADIPSTLGDGAALGGPRIDYLAIEESASAPETLAHAARRLRPGQAVAIGFPDVLAEPGDALRALAGRFRRGAPDLVLGLFPTDRPDKADVAIFDADAMPPDAAPGSPIAGRVRDILHKPGAAAPRDPATGRCWTWLLLVGSARFAARLESFARQGRGPRDREPQVSDVVLEAITQGDEVVALAFPDGSHLDIGTPEDLERARMR